MAFNSGVAVESRAKGDPAVERVRERLMGAFELERRRITAANAVQGNLARRSLRTSRCLEAIPPRVARRFGSEGMAHPPPCRIFRRT